MRKPDIDISKIDGAAECEVLRRIMTLTIVDFADTLFEDRPLLMVTCQALAQVAFERPVIDIGTFQSLVLTIVDLMDRAYNQEAHDEEV
jgi:hypothetical protein